MQEERFNAALAALSDPSNTTIVLVTRPDRGAIAEAARTSDELRDLALTNQRLAVNGVFHASDRTDEIACAIEALGTEALETMPPSLRALSQDRVPLRPFDTVGLPALSALLAEPQGPLEPVRSRAALVSDAPGLDRLAHELAAAGRGLVMVMGKGLVGKTTVAAALALGLVQRGKAVHLSTTDPAAHLSMTLGSDVPGLRVDRIDPKLAHCTL